MTPTQRAFFKFEKRHRDRLHKRLAIPDEAEMTSTQVWGVLIVCAVLAIACLVFA
jgi:hypothetical protein